MFKKIKNTCLKKLAIYEEKEELEKSVRIDNMKILDTYFKKKIAN